MPWTKQMTNLVVLYTSNTYTLKRGLALKKREKGFYTGEKLSGQLQLHLIGFEKAFCYKYIWHGYWFSP